MKKKLLCVDPRIFDYSELGREEVKQQYEILFYSITKDHLPGIMCEGIGEIGKQFAPEEVLEDLLAFYEEHNAEGVLFSQDYPSALFASVLIDKKNCSGPSIGSALLCQHKYASRLLQRELVPEATPPFALIEKDTFNPLEFPISFPVFTKPVKSSFSILANRIDTMHELHALAQQFSMPVAFIDQLQWFFSMYSNLELKPHHRLVEGLLEGVQVTLEGFIYEGDVEIIGVVDSIMYPNTISFKRFEYPSRLPKDVLDRMGKIAEKVVRGHGFSNTLFNIEFMFNPDTNHIGIIEIHSRMSAQFADLYEKVDGTNGYDVLLALAEGRRPVFQRGNGKCTIAASFVLRIFENKQIIGMPTITDMEASYKQFPDLRLYFFHEPGQMLNDIKQDGKSFRYGLIHLGARDAQELNEKFEACNRLLPFTFR